MSGYLDVKCPARATRGIYLFKAWKKQWCILRPNPTEENSGVLALHSAVGVLANSTIDLPAGSAVCRTKSRTHQYAFGVFLAGRYRKPYVLLAGQTESETQMWMSKIRALLNGKKHYGKNIRLKNLFEVSIIDNEFSRNCLLYGVHGTLTVSSHGILISQPNNDQLKIFIAWKHFSDIILTGSQNIPDTNKICQLFTNSRFSGGAGHLSIFCALGAELVRAVKAARAGAELTVCRDSHKRISRSESDLYSWSQDSSIDDGETAGIRRSSWYSGPSEVSLDDTDLIRTKDANIVPSGQLLRCAAEDDLYPISYSKQHLLSYVHKFSQAYADTPPDRRSCTSLASGIYEEILEDTDSHQAANQNQKCSSNDNTQINEDSTAMDISMSLEENTYESVAECVYATMRRTGKRYAPPPLPPRSVRSASIAAKSATKLTDSWNSRLMDTDVVDGAVMHHGGSLGSLPHCYTEPPLQQEDYTKTLPKFHKTKSFFRKRIKSESRTALGTPRADKVPGEVKKKKFDPASRRKDSVTPSKLEMIKNFSMSRALMKNLRISSPSLRKLGEARSCEYLDTDASATEMAEPRCSKSAESLGGLPTALDPTPTSPCSAAPEDDGQDLSVMYAESTEQFSLPQDIVELILKGRDDLAELRLRRRQLSESDYIPMSPNGILNCTTSHTPCESHYTIMTSPASSMAAVAVPSVAPDIVT